MLQNCYNSLTKYNSIFFFVNNALETHHFLSSFSNFILSELDSSSVADPDALPLAQIKRIISISGNALPQRFLRIVDHYGDKPEARKQAGIAFATEQIVDLFANGIRAVHVYSMNKPDVARKIQSNLSDILGK